MATEQRPGLQDDRILLAGRTIGALLLLAMAVIHLMLWFDGYGEIPVIGPAFLVDTVGGTVLAVGVFGAARRHLPLVAVIAALFTAGTLGALVISMAVGLFGVSEMLDTPFVPASLVVEAAGVLVLAGTAYRARTG